MLLLKIAKWIRFRYLRATGQVPWWWETDRRLDPAWSAEADELLLEAKREGLWG